MDRSDSEDDAVTGSASDRHWGGLTPMARIEIVVDGEHLPTIRDLLLDAGATGFTTIRGVSGFGHHGEHEGRLLFNDRNSLTMVVCVVPFDRVEPVLAGVRRLLDDCHGVVFVSEPHVSRPEYCRPVAG
ncbi:MAG: DUF190 domain-containing protein [Ilumatobacteraceae bacterium]